jgi:RNA polymerase sigma-70 factor (ECF subfamily)
MYPVEYGSGQRNDLLGPTYFEGFLFNFDRAFLGDRQSSLISSAKRSVEDRQRDVYDSHCHRVFALAYYMVGNEIHAEEAVGSTFIKAFHSAEEPDAKQIDICLIGELQKRVSFEETLPPAETSIEDSLASRNVKRPELEDAIRQLPPTERLAFLLKDVEGYSIPAISERMNISATELPAILMSARIRLRSLLAAAKASDSQAEAA